MSGGLFGWASDLLFGKPPSAGDIIGQQSAANADTAAVQSHLNNPNTFTPFGSQVWWDNGLGRPTMTQTLSPTEQQKYDLSSANQIAGLNILGQSMPNIQAALTQPFGIGGTPLQGGYNPAYAPQAGMQYDPGSFGSIQTGLNFAGAPGMPVASDQTRNAVTQSLYEQGARFLDPQWQQAAAEQTANLANQGITAGSGAYNTQQENFNRAKANAYNQLMQSSVSGGLNAMQQLYDMAMGARKQGVGEITTQGQFANQAQQQLAQELLQRMLQRNAAVTGQANIAAQEAGLEGSQRAQAYNEYAQNRTMPLNLFNALLQGSQINVPQFQPTSPAQVAPTNYLGAQQLANNMGQGQLQSTLNLLGSLGSSAFGSNLLPTLFGALPFLG